MSDVGEARRAIVERAGELGFGEADQGRIAIVVTEAAKNLLKHARGGQLLLSEPDAGATAHLQLLALDSGPGLRDAHSAMRDGYSTVGTPGTGLGAMRRLSNRFALYTWRSGTAVLCEFRAPSTAPADPTFEHAALALPKRGETVSGDGWGIARVGGEPLIMMVDGLGHGLQAADAAHAALAVLQRPRAALPDLLQDVHAALRSTRGAAVALVRIGRGRLEFLGAGNVVCRLAAAAKGDDPGLDKQFVSHSGTVGHTLRRAEPFRHPLPSRGVVILHTDGISSRFAVKDFAGLLDQPAALIAGVLLQSHGRRSDDATILVLRHGHTEPESHA